ncbi:MAG TPA: ZIP family zinc transporter [Candidatus Dormibacteraeota bacterium]
MSVWQALAWGGLSSSALYIGEALAGPLERARRVTGLVMAFGAGTLLSAIAYELIPETNLHQGAGIGVAFLLGALVYYAGDRVIDGRGGADRQQIEGGAEAGSGAAMFLGALLDGVPEAFILGIGLALGGSVSVAFVTAVFVSNIPQGVAGTASLRAAGASDRRIFWMWTALTVACAVTAALGFLLAQSVPVQGVYAQAFAAGAVLTMLADSMMPEAFEHGGGAAGLATVLGYLVAAALTVLQ